jgi:hypothetical protein
LELVTAAREVSEVLSRRGLSPRVIVKRGRVQLERSWFFWEPPGWSLSSAKIERRRGSGWELVASTQYSPLIAVVHTPPGTVEGRSRILRAGEKAEEGQIAVALKFTSDLYYELNDARAAAVIATHGGPGVRYFSLFPLPEELPSTVAVSIDRDRALRLDGEQVRVTVDAKYSEPVTPILHVGLGSAHPRVLLIAHVCHPKPGAHDNASGVAALVELLTLLLGFENVLEELGIGVDALIVPEYTGTALALSDGLVNPASYVAAVSIDMVGANLEVTGGVLNLYTSPLSLPSPLDPYVYRSLWLAYSNYRAFDGPSYPARGVHALPYSHGSDHDITLAVGIPSSLVNEWPDRFYHTNLDTPNNLSPNSLALVASAVATAIMWLGVTLSRGRVADDLRLWVKRQAESAIMDSSLGILPEQVASAARELAEYGTGTTLARLAELLGKESEGRRWEEDIESIARRGPLTSRFLRRMGGEAGAKLLALSESERSLYTGLVALVAQATRSASAARLEAMVSRGEKVDEQLLTMVIDLIKGGT